MEKFKYNLSEKKFKLHLVALLLMLIPSVPMFFAAQYSATGLIWFLVGIVVLGNLIVVFIP
ncbi:MAG: hypothetical protein JSV42_19350 [Chloroflexota bacterium]|nr:MAG: hypothetical protein JSV42_19350 [Chloroflexota bacterium]